MSAPGDEVRAQAVLGLVEDLLDAQPVYAVGKAALDDPGWRGAQELHAQGLEHRDQAGRRIGVAGEHDAQDPAFSAGLVAQDDRVFIVTTSCGISSEATTLAPASRRCSGA